MTVQPIELGGMGDLEGDWLGPIESVTTNVPVALVGMSRDRTTLYGRTTSTSPGNRSLMASTNEGETWSTLNTFSELVEGMTVLDDGEALVVTQSTSSTPGFVYRSTGWATNPATATWARVLTTQAGYIRSVWGMHRWSHAGEVVVTCEYGVQTDSGADQSAKATRVYLSEDAGRTWRVVLDLTALLPGVYPLHVHAVAYIADWDRIFLTYGDTAKHLTSSQANMMFSDDRGATWQHVEMGPDWTGRGYPFQHTSIAVTESAVLTMPDGIPYGVVALNRQAYRQFGSPTPGPLWAGNTGAQGISFCSWRNDTGDYRPLLMSTQAASADVPAMIHMSPSGKGGDWVELFRYDDSSGTINYTVGPTAAGNVLWSRGASLRRAPLLRAGAPVGVTRWQTSGDTARLTDTAATDLTVGSTAQPRLTMTSSGVIQRDGQTYRRGGANAFQIVNNDYPSSSGRLMSTGEIDSLLDKAAALKVGYLRVHTMGANIGPNASHLVAGVTGTGDSPTITYRQAVWDVMDYVVKAASDRGLYLMVPMTDELGYYHGGKRQWVNFRRPGTVSLDGNVKSANSSTQRAAENYFYTDTQIRADFRKYLSDWLNHVNPLTGRAYKDEPAIAIIETGNELWTADDFRSWTPETAAHIKSVAPKVLVADGMSADGSDYWDSVGGDSIEHIVTSQALASPHVDIVGIHPYSYFGASQVTEGARRAAAAGKSFVVGEYPWSKAAAPQIEAAARAAANVATTMFWSLQNDADLHNGGHGAGYGTDDASFYVPGRDATMQAAVTRVTSHGQALIDAVSGVIDYGPTTPLGSRTYQAGDVPEPTYARTYSLPNLPAPGSSTTINAAWAAALGSNGTAQDGDCITIPAGSYAASGNLDVRKDGVTIKALGAVTVTHQNTTNHGVRFYSKRNQLRGKSATEQLEFRTTGVSGRGDQNQQGMATLLLDPGVEDFVAQDVTVRGAKAAGVFAYNAKRYLLNRVRSIDSLADAFHNANGCRYGMFIDCLSRNAGDDLWAAVHYDPRDKPSMVSTDFTVIRHRGYGNTHGRGLAVINCRNVYAQDVYMERTGAAGIIIGREDATGSVAYQPQPVENVTVKGAVLNGCNWNTQDHGAIFLNNYRGNQPTYVDETSGATVAATAASQQVRSVTLQDVSIIDTNKGRASHSGQAVRGVVYNQGTIAAELTRFAFYGDNFYNNDPANAFGGNLDVNSSVTRTGWTFPTTTWDNSAYVEAVAPVTYPVTGEVAYRFTGNLLTPETSTPVTGSTMTFTGLATARVASDLGYSTGTVLQVAGENRSATDTTRYVELVLSHPGQWKLNGLTYKAARGGASTPRGVVVRTSQDGFVAALAGGGDISTTRATFTSFTIDTSSLSTVRTGQLRVRLYPYGPETISTVELDDISFAVTAVTAG